jgi:hypothetical protein
MYHRRRKVRKILDIVSVRYWDKFSRCESRWGVSASRIVIALSACWLINLALAPVPPPSILANVVEWLD